MRALLPALPLALALLLAPAPPAGARPEFARREQKACGYCHINPRGGGARNRTGLAYARNEFAFPPRAGDLSSFTNERQRAAMVRVRRLLDLQHIPAALKELRRLERSVKEPAANQLVKEELHGLEVKGDEILGQARLLLREKEAEEAVALLVMLSVEYKGLDIRDRAEEDLREAQSDKALRELVKKERTEAKARLRYLDALRHRADGKDERADKALRKVAESYPGTRAAEDAEAALKDRHTVPGEK